MSTTYQPTGPFVQVTSTTTPQTVAVTNPNNSQTVRVSNYSANLLNFQINSEYNTIISANAVVYVSAINQLSPGNISVIISQLAGTGNVYLQAVNQY